MTVSRSFAIPRHIRLAVFDLDGTLVTHDYPYWCEEAVRIYPALGAERVTAARVRRDFRTGDMFAALPACNRDDLIARFWDMYDSGNAPHSRCLPGVRRALAQMKASGLMIAIVTARLEHPTSLTPRLKRWRLDHLVDFLLTCIGPNDETYRSKVPVLLELLRMAEVSGAEALMAGDTPTDIESARLAGYALRVAACTGGLLPSVLAAAGPTSNRAKCRVTLLRRERYRPRLSSRRVT